jgi:hypothetical protein
MSEDMHLEKHETQLRGGWNLAGGRMVEDDIAKRIAALIHQKLEPLATSNGGWDKLFRDPSDKRLWELTYPASGTHGGGPPTLTVISEEEARTKYSF